MIIETKPREGASPFAPQTIMASKRYKKALEATEADAVYSLSKALSILAGFPKAKFDESV